MEHLFHALLRRIKRNILLILIVPLLLAGLGYFFQVKAQPIVNYEAQTKIELGYYDDINLNDSRNARSVITSYAFLEEVFPDYDMKDIKAIKRNLEVKDPADTRVEIRYKGNSEDEVIEILEEIAYGFLAYDKRRFDDKYAILEENYEQLIEETVSEDSKVEKQRFIFELQNELLTVYPAQLSDPISINEYRMEDFSAKKRAVLGGLVGITIMFGYIVIPILFREDHD